MTFCRTRPMVIVCSWPRVMSSPVRAPRRWTSVLVPIVVPWTNATVRRSSAPTSRSSASAVSRTQVTTPSAGSSGVVRAFVVSLRPRSLSTTQSVNVPPMSTAILKARSVTVRSS